MTTDSLSLPDPMLGELAELAMDLARDFAARAKASESVEEAERFALSFECMARSVRLSLALQRRLERDRRSDQAQALETRRTQLRAALIPEVRSTARHIGEAFERETELAEALAQEALYETFLDQPLPLVIERLRKRLRLPAERRGSAHGEGGGLQPPQSASPTAPPEGEQPSNSSPSASARSGGGGSARSDETEEVAGRRAGPS